MSAPPTFSSIHEEVDYYDRLLYRLVMTKDEQLEGAVNTHLPTLLEVLATPHEAVRNKVRPPRMTGPTSQSIETDEADCMHRLWNAAATS